MDRSIFCDFRDFEHLPHSLRDQIATNAHEVNSLHQYELVSGHFSLATLTQITVMSAIGTVLREPRARLISLYMYWRTPKIFEAVLPYSAHHHARLPFADFLTEPRVAAAVDNQVCRMLLYGDPRIPDDEFIANHDIHGVASDAIAQLDSLGFVGILELGADTWQGLGQFFGVELEPRSVNVTGEADSPLPGPPGEQLFTAKAFESLEQRTSADRLVYDHALMRAGLAASDRLELTETALATQIQRWRLQH